MYILVYICDMDIIQIIALIGLIGSVGGIISAFVRSYKYSKEREEIKRIREEKKKNEYADDFSKSLEERIKDYREHQKKNLHLILKSLVYKLP